MKRDLIIYKQNPVIRGHFLDSEQKNTLLSEFALDILNAIYLTIQQNLFAIHTKEFQKNVKVEIDIRQIQKLLIRKRRDFIEIKNAIEELYQTDLVLKDFRHPISGTRYREFHTRIIDSYGYRKDDENICDIHISEIFLINIMRHPKEGAKDIGNFTPIRMNVSAALKGKYTKRLYEYIESVTSLNCHFSLKIDALNKLFGTDYTHFSKLTRIVERSKEQISGLCNFSFQVFKEDGLISFTVTPKTKIEDFS